MKILHVITGLSTGGAERTLYNLLYGGIADRFNNHVISLRDIGTLGEPIKQLGVPVTPLGMRRNIPSISGMMQLRQIIQSFRPDILQGWMYHGNIAATLAATFAEKPTLLLWNIRQSLYNLGYEKLLTRQVIRFNRFFSSRPAIILYNSRVARKQHEAFGFISKSGRVIPNGIDIRRFGCSKQSRKAIRVTLSIPNQALVVGHVARFHPMKDHPLFLRAAVEIAHQNKRVHFLLSGRNVTMENREIRHLIPEHLYDRFHLLGEHSDIPELMTAMDVFSSSSSYGEGFPNVIGEAMATRLPCVATNVGDSMFLVGDTGLIILPGNKSTLVAGLSSILNMSDIKRESLGVAARKRIVTNFSLDAVINRYSDMYENILEQKMVVHL